jgi:molybdenum cofactor synthesis domain-containing protein
MTERDFGPMRPFGDLCPVEQALDQLLAAIEPLTEAEAVPVVEAVGRVAAETVTAPVPVPGFRRAMMDGFAVRATDIAGASADQPMGLQLAGVVHAGSQGGPLEAGFCYQIATGSPLPAGADTVVPVEQTHRASDDRIQIHTALPEQANIAEVGADFAAGDVAVAEGTVCTPAICGAIACVGLARTWVIRRPRVAIWGSGDEVRPAGETLQYGQIHDSNGPALGALVAQHGGIATLHGALPDEGDAIGEALVARDGNVVLITGGSSVGERDLVARVIAERAEVLFHGIAVKPGKPTLAAMLDGRLLLGMPGNPASCLMMSHLLLVPALRRLAGLPDWKPRVVPATLVADVKSPAGKRHFYSVRLDGDRAVPAFKGSGAISSLSQADGWIEIPAEVDRLAADTPVDVRLF